MKVRNSVGQSECFYLLVYASLHSSVRRCLWDYIRLLALRIKGPWLLAGDFNCIFDSLERVGGSMMIRRG